MRLVNLVVILGLVVPLSSGFSSSEVTKKPLDLPAGGGRASEDEDAEEALEFLGETFHGAAFVWCIPNFKMW